MLQFYRKSLSRYRVTINPSSVSAWNPTFRNRVSYFKIILFHTSSLLLLLQDSVSPTLSTLPRKQAPVSSPPHSPREKPNVKAVLMSVKTIPKSVSPLEEIDTPSSEFEKPQVYKMTPQQNRKSMSTPPASPLPVPTTVPVLVNPLAVRSPPPLPPKPNCPSKPQHPVEARPVPRIQIQENNTSRVVKFDPSMVPPPIPPRYTPSPF